MNFKLIIILLLSLLTGIKTQKKCDCTLQYSVSNQLIKNLQQTFVNSQANDNRDICDFRCTDWCASRIREEINQVSSSAIITDAGKENMCQKAFPNSALIKDGITIRGLWDLEECANSDDQEDIQIQDKVCCRFCQCKLAYLNPKTSNNPIIEFDFSDLISKKRQVRAFICEDLNHLDECEQDCRIFVSDKIGYLPLKQSSSDEYDPLLNLNDSDKICQVLNRKINSPGINLIARYETGTRFMHKDISLGNICCKRTCTCEIVYKTKNKNITNTECKVNIADRMPKRNLSYYCDDELKDCIEDCKVAAGITLLNDKIKDKETSALDIEIFSSFPEARKACIVYQKNTVWLEGVDVYLRYGTSEGSGHKQFYPVRYFSKLINYTYP